MNEHRFPVLITLMLVIASLLACLLGCGMAEESAAPETGADIAANLSAASILAYEGDEGIAELNAYFADGKVPEEVNILYDQMGSNPDVTITDPETIAELYRLLSKVEIVGETGLSVTDCYHHIQFKLGEEKYIFFSFEGEEVWRLGANGYELKNSKNLFRYMRELTEESLRQDGD